MLNFQVCWVFPLASRPGEMWEGLCWVQNSAWRNSPSLPFVFQLPQLWRGDKSHPALVISSAQWMEAALTDDTATFELLPAARGLGTKRASEGTRPSPPSAPCPASRRWHSPGKFLMSWSLTHPYLPAGSSSIGGVRGRVSSPLAPLALWAVGDQQYRDTSQRRSHSTALHPRALLDCGSDRQDAPLGTASLRVTPDPRLNTGGLTHLEGNILGRLSTRKGICRPGRKSLDEICVAIFQTSWERV